MRRGRLPTGSLRAIIKMRLEPYDVARGTKTKNSLGEYTESDETHPVDLALYQPSESMAQNIAGEGLSGDLYGLALPDTDIEPDDELTHGGVEYEVESVTGVPNDRSPRHLKLALTRK